jgi:hypothetical protein
MSEDRLLDSRNLMMLFVILEVLSSYEANDFRNCAASKHGTATA